MSWNPVEPQLGVASFSCPHCGAYAQQAFLRPYANFYDKNKGEAPSLVSYDDDGYNALKSQNVDREPEDKRREREQLLRLLERLKKHTLTFHRSVEDVKCYWEMINLAFSKCYSCDGFAVWVEDKLVYPIRNSAIIAHDEMPTDVRRDFEEAASIVDKSPRGAAALLRLCIQKLMGVLGEKGKDLNEDIASLVRKGLAVQVQQALDIVRVTGNNAVHPGQIDLQDNKATATTLFSLVNLIVENRIAQPNHIAAMFKNLPPGALEQIERRDAPEQNDGPAPNERS
jgi:hypothetical protein